MKRRQPLAMAAVLLLAAAGVHFAWHPFTRGGSASTQSPQRIEIDETPTSVSAAHSVTTEDAQPSVVTATPPSEPPAPPAPSPEPTPCSVTLLTAAGAPFHVIGPGSTSRDIPSPGDYVRDDCTGHVFFRDPITHEPLPSTQVGSEPREPVR